MERVRLDSDGIAIKTRHGHEFVGGDGSKHAATTWLQIALLKRRLLADGPPLMLSDRVAACDVVRFALDLDAPTALLGTTPTTKGDALGMAIVPLAAQLTAALTAALGGGGDARAATAWCLVAVPDGGGDGGKRVKWGAHVYWPLLKSTRHAGAALVEALRTAVTHDPSPLAHALGVTHFPPDAVAPPSSVIDTHMYSGPWTQLRCVGSPPKVLQPRHAAAKAAKDAALAAAGTAVPPPSGVYHVRAVLHNGTPAPPDVASIVASYEDVLTCLAVCPTDGIDAVLTSM